MVNETALPDMCAFSKGHKLRTAAFFTGVKKKKKKNLHVNFLYAPISFPSFNRVEEEIRKPPQDRSNV